jgi:NADH-quinone oxidoreductase subunit H
MNASSLINLFLFPGLLFAVPAAWFFTWGEHKATARMQRRIGLPLLQPLYDFIKLMGKRTPERHGIENDLRRFYPVLSVLSLLGAIALLPVFPSHLNFSGDGVVLVVLLELPSLCFILAGFTSGSVYGKIGASREAVLSGATNLVFLLSFVAIAATRHTVRLSELAGPSANPGHWIGVVGILLCIPAKLRLNPFSTSSAEQEIYAGALTEYAGGPLGFWKLAHGLEWFALTGLVATLVLPVAGGWAIHALLFVAVCFLQVMLLSAMAAGTARFTLERSIRFYWQWAAILGVLAVTSAIWMGFRL